MSVALYAILLLAVLPAAIAWLARQVVRQRSSYVSWLIVGLAAAVPTLWMFFAAQDADGITRAASYYVAPGAFAFSLYFAFLGYRLGHPND